MPRYECKTCGRKHNKPGACKNKHKAEWWLIHPAMRAEIEARIALYAERAAARKPLFEEKK